MLTSIMRCTDKVNEEVSNFVAAGGRVQDWTPAEIGKWEPSWNIKPTQAIPAILVHKGALRFGTAHWSLVPPWATDLNLPYPTFNARSEGAAAKATWRAPVKSRRAIIPANGYYEWMGPKGGRAPQWIRDPARPVIGFAGLYSWWHPPGAGDDDGWTLTAVILTCAAVPRLAHIHDRTPVILPRQLWEHRIDPDVAGDQNLVDEAVAAGRAVADTLIWHEVAPLKGNGPELVEAVR